MIEQHKKSQPLIGVANDPRGRAVGDRHLEPYRAVRIDGGSASELVARFDQTRPDCAVIVLESEDLASGDFAAWKELRQYCDSMHIPFVIITGAYDRELTGMLLADAVLRQPLDSSELRMNLDHLIGRRFRILDQILIDPATGTYNYRYMRREVQKQLQDMKRSYISFSLVYMEIDSARRLDLDDRRSADRALADFIQASVRPMDCLGQINGRGFVLLLPKTVKADAIKLMTRLTSLFSKQMAETSGGTRSVAFSAKVRDFNDPDLTAEECLAAMPFSEETDPSERAGLVLDGTLNDSNPHTRKLMIAVIDDDRLIREMLKHQLADVGGGRFDVEIRDFADGEDFFNDPWHRQNERYVLIIDRIMPKMDGLEVLHRIRNGYDRNRYICVMLSSKGAETDITLAIQRGANDYLVKPFRMKELRARLHRLVGGAT